jgi:hypothetical protein
MWSPAVFGSGRIASVVAQRDTRGK